ncbi:MAG: ribosome assembly cofactor RimP [Bacteroidales bacterium]|nr:ribosome assembly cofactor RimP [Bacteroidales bacterium]
MIDERFIRKLAEEKLGESGVFLTDVIVKQGNSIHVFIDGDQGVTIDECVALSRHIESNLNREEEDFNLQVSTAGVDQPLKFARQYIKNIGRKLSIELKNGEAITGKLLAADNEKIQLQTETQKGRKTITGDTIELNYTEIVRALCLISFK